jgi:hypothetical protein
VKFISCNDCSFKLPLGINSVDGAERDGVAGDGVYVSSFVDDFNLGQCGGGDRFDGGFNAAEHALVSKLSVEGFDGIFDVGVHGCDAESSTFATDADVFGTFSFHSFPDAGEGFFGGPADIEQSAFLRGSGRDRVSPNVMAERDENGGLGDACEALGECGFPILDFVASVVEFHRPGGPSWFDANLFGARESLSQEEIDFVGKQPRLGHYVHIKEKFLVQVKSFVLVEAIVDLGDKFGDVGAVAGHKTGISTSELGVFGAQKKTEGEVSEQGTVVRSNIFIEEIQTAGLRVRL